MTRNISIERLRPENASLLANVATDVFDDPINAESVAAFVGDARHAMYLALDGDLVVGMVSGVEYFHPDKPSQLWINEVGVAPTHQRRGIGRSLVKALLAEGRERGCSTAWLGTDLDNAAAHACFESAAGEKAASPFLMYEWDLVR